MTPRLRWIHCLVAVLVVLLATSGSSRAASPYTWICSTNDAGNAQCSDTSIPPMPTARTGLGVAAYGNQIYAAGGMPATGVAPPPYNLVEAYTPTGGWVCSIGDPAPGCSTSTLKPMPTARSFFGMIQARGKLWAIGGLGTGSRGGASPALGQVEAYDVGTNSWTCSTDDATNPGCATATLPPMPTPRSDFGIALGNDGLIYVFGGLLTNGTATDFVEAFDPLSSSWFCSTGDAAAGCIGHSTLLPMPNPNADFAIAPGPSTRILLFGGTRGGVATQTVEIYDLIDRTWLCSPGDTDPYGRCSATFHPTSMPTARNHMQAVPGVNGLIYVMGGYRIDLGLPYLDVVEAYDPANDRWYCSPDSSPAGTCFSVSQNPMPTARADFGAARGTNDNRLYAIGGNNMAGELPTVEAYDTVSTTVAAVSRFTAQRHAGQILFTWRLSRATAVTGFNLFAGSHRLNAHVLPAHGPGLYHHVSSRPRETRYTLQVLLRNGQRISVSTG